MDHRRQLCRWLSRHPCSIGRRTDAYRGNRSGSHFVQQRASQTDSRTGRRAYVDPRCQRLADHQESFRGIAGNNHDNRVSRRGVEAAGLQREGKHRDFERTGRSAHLLSRRAADAESGQEGRHHAARARGDRAHQMETSLPGRAAQPRSHGEDLDVRQLPFLLRRRQNTGAGCGRPAERPRFVRPHPRSQANGDSHAGCDQVAHRPRPGHPPLESRFHVSGLAGWPLRSFDH